MARLEAPELPITPRRKTPPTASLLLWTLWRRDLVFLSAYGLEKKYGRTTKEVRPLPFIWTHYLKLLSMCIVGYAAYLLLNAFYISYPASTIFGVLSQLTMLCNLGICSFETFAPGPYWYFGLMLQLYVVYRLLLFRRSWGVIVGAILVCSIAQAFVTPDRAVMTWLRTNFVGSVLPFGLGLLYARYEEDIQLSKTAYGIIALVSIALIFVTSLSFLPWITTPIFVCALGISCTQLLPQSVNKPLAWVGGISAADLRQPPDRTPAGACTGREAPLLPLPERPDLSHQRSTARSTFPAHPQSLNQAFHEAG